MKNLIRSFLLTFSSVFFVFLGSSASADEFWGSFCWAVVLNDSEPGDINTLKLGLTDIGDFHFTLNGFLLSTGVDFTDHTLFSGNAEILGGNLILGL